MKVALLPARALVALLLLLFGCGDDDEANVPIETASVTQAAGPSTDVLDAARADLAGRLAVAVSQIADVESCAFTWPDGSIGVAEPGRIYTQALVPGWLAIFEHNGQEYRYHGAGTEFTAADFVFDAEVLDDRCP